MSKKEIKKGNLRKSCAISIINQYCFHGGGGGDAMMMVVVCNDWHLDDRCLLVLLPVPCQPHSGVLAEVLVDGENENYEDEMTR